MQYQFYNSAETERIIQRVPGNNDPFNRQEAHRLNDNYMLSRYEIAIGSVEYNYYRPHPIPHQTPELISCGENGIYGKLIFEFNRMRILKGILPPVNKTVYTKNPCRTCHTANWPLNGHFGLFIITRNRTLFFSLSYIRISAENDAQLKPRHAPKPPRNFPITNIGALYPISHLTKNQTRRITSQNHSKTLQEHHVEKRT